MVINAWQAESGRDECGSGLAVGTNSLAIQYQLGVEFPWAPAVQNFSYISVRQAEQLHEDAEVGSRGNDAPDVEVAVWPSIEPPSQARKKRIVYRGMAERALNADRPKVPVATDVTGHTNNGVKFEEKKSDRWIIEIYLAALNLFD